MLGNTWVVFDRNNHHIYFSTKEPIFTGNIPIDSARQTKDRESIKNVQNFTVAEKLGTFHEKVAPII
jgi:hypothetical protein